MEILIETEEARRCDRLCRCVQRGSEADVCATGGEWRDIYIIIIPV